MRFPAVVPRPRNPGAIVPRTDAVEFQNGKKSPQPLAARHPNWAFPTGGRLARPGIQIICHLPHIVGDLRPAFSHPTKPRGSLADKETGLPRWAWLGTSTRHINAGNDVAAIKFQMAKQ